MDIKEIHLITNDNIVPKEVETSSNCITGDRDHLLPKLQQAFKKAKSVDIIVAFLMESGVKLIAEDLKELVQRNVPIRILTGNYLNITQPQALYMLKDLLGDKVDLRFYNVKNRSFHPKAYIFHYEEGGDIFVGSSNISRSALTSGIEWNYKLSKSDHAVDFQQFYNVFEDLFLNHSIIVDEEELKRYSKSWIRPKVYKDFENIENVEEKEIDKIIPIFEPRGAQIEALYGLRKSREDGFDKGLVVAATGIGKTYLAAFDSRAFKRVLFVAHREEIIKQAAASFRNVRQKDSIGLFYSDVKENDKDLIFALVQTIGKDEYLNEDCFKRDYFDYIVIDEFHHAVAGNYKNIIEYFKPKFLLGLTATPERLDNKDVFALCDYNMVYEVRLREAINKGWLVPFRYYGIYDETVNYEQIDFKNGKYDEKKLEEALMLNKRAELILKHYEKYSSSSALGFCTSKNHAEYMAKYFSENGVKACAVYSGASNEYSKHRETAIEMLKKGEIKVIFSVDMFNEGLDITAVDLVMFLRPTESPTVFLQQLGRGLRKHKDKKYLNVLDFIGNYKKSNLIPFLLTGKKEEAKVTSTRNPQQLDYPEDCVVDFDFRLIDIFKKQAQSEMTLKDLIKEEFYRIKEDIKRRPLRTEMFAYMDDDIYANMRTKSKMNVFNDYMDFLDTLGELTEEEKNIKASIAYDFIKTVETTSMAKTYKIPILLAFYNEGNLKLEINAVDVYKSFVEFYCKGSNAIDMLKDKSSANFREWDKAKYYNFAKQRPIKFLAKTHGDFFYIKDENFCLNEKLEEFKNNKSFMTDFKDAIDYRTMQYYKNRFEEKNK